MKKIILTIIVTIITITTYSTSDKLSKIPEKINVLNGIKDGWYAAIIKYTNYSTGTDATYKLNVKVEYGNVVEIDFGNGGSIHKGYNNEGYIYSGGYLSYEKDYEGNIIAATATVTTSDSDGMRYYKIRIE